LTVLFCVKLLIPNVRQCLSWYCRWNLFLCTAKL